MAKNRVKEIESSTDDIFHKMSKALGEWYKTPEGQAEIAKNHEENIKIEEEKKKFFSNMELSISNGTFKDWIDNLCEHEEVTIGLVWTFEFLLRFNDVKTEEELESVPFVTSFTSDVGFVGGFYFHRMVNYSDTFSQFNSNGTNWQILDGEFRVLKTWIS